MRMSRKSHRGKSSRQAQMNIGAQESTSVPSVTDIQHANSIRFEPKNARQRHHMRSIQENQLTLVLGPSGTGKTHVSIAALADGILRGRHYRAVLMRPAIALENEEHGFLPGSLDAKVGPWAKPMLRKLTKLIGASRVLGMLSDGHIEICPFTYLRGDEFEDRTFVMLDEAQNCTIAQLRAFTTRIADGATIVIAGDIEQHDMRGRSGFDVLHELIDASPDINCGIAQYRKEDIVRGALCQSFVDMWGHYDRGLTDVRTLVAAE